MNNNVYGYAFMKDLKYKRDVLYEENKKTF